MNETISGVERQSPVTLTHTFNLALARHRAGGVEEAEKLYRAVVMIEPNHFGALHHLGIIATQNGKLEEAEALLRKVAAIDPSSADALTNLGMALTRLRRFDDAVGIYEKALALDPSNVEAHNNLGATLQTLGRLEEAAAEFAAAVRLRPGNAAVHNNLGIVLAALGRAEEAVAEHKKAVALNPRYTDANDNLGNTLVKLRRYDEAVARLYRALDLTPQSATTHNALSAALLAVKGYEEAVAHCRRAIEIKPDFVEAYNNLGLALAGLKRYDEAVAHYRRAIEIKPELAEPHNNIGNALAALRRGDEAIAEYRRALEIRPDFFEADNNLGHAMFVRRYAGAIPHFHKALEHKPDFAETLVNLANALTAVNRHDEALVCYERALAIANDLAEAHAGYGNYLMIVGRIEQSRQEIERAIALGPTRPEFYRSLAAVKHFGHRDSELAAMQELADTKGELSDDERMELHFALGKAYGDVDRHDRAFRHLTAANALKRRQIVYNEAAALGFFKRIEKAFTPEVMRRLTGAGDPTSLPIFIVGMPRSGTTLVEQVLASHPLVFGAGEIGELEATVAAVAGSDGTVSFLEGIGAMIGEQMHGIGTRYRDRVVALAPTAQRITDKMLTNFRWVGLIQLALPNARIVHVRRDPADTCLSCFSKLFAGDLPFTYDLAELGRYYRAYAALMAHWRSVLPDGGILEVQYEELVTDFATQARRLIAYCGLEWDDRCSSFYETQRPVTTSSAVQVRRPIYQDSLGASLPYKDMLRPLLDELGIDSGNASPLTVKRDATGEQKSQFHDS